MSRPRFATVWLDGCSGCHMSFLDIDERLIAVADRVEVVYSPLVDNKKFPEHVDVTLVEGAVSSEEDVEKIRHIRRHTKCLVSLGDCAVTSNVPSMRNHMKVAEIMEHAYRETADLGDEMPSQVVPKLLDKVVPVHEIVDVDVFVPGCPPRADAIFKVILDLLDGKKPEIAGTIRFG